jgi:hypothetical protein
MSKLQRIGVILSLGFYRPQAMERPVEVQPVIAPVTAVDVAPFGNYDPEKDPLYIHERELRRYAEMITG